VHLGATPKSDPNRGHSIYFGITQFYYFYFLVFMELILVF